MDKALTIIETSKMLAVHPNTVRNLIKSGKINAFKVGKQWRILECELELISKGREVK